MFNVLLIRFWLTSKCKQFGIIIIHKLCNRWTGLWVECRCFLVTPIGRGIRFYLFYFFKHNFFTVVIFWLYWCITLPLSLESDIKITFGNILWPLWHANYITIYILYPGPCTSHICIMHTLCLLLWHNHKYHLQLSR